MTRAALRSIHSTDVDDLAAWRPATDAFAVPVRLLIGPADDRGEESFDVLVCSPAWLAQQAVTGPVLDGRHHLVVRDFDWPEILAYILRRIDRCVGDRWEDVAEQLSRLGHWEFEDYA